MSTRAPVEIPAAFAFLNTDRSGRGLARYSEGRACQCRRYRPFLGGLRVPDRNHYIRQVYNTPAGRHICILIRDLDDAAGNRAPPVRIDAVVFHRVAPFLSGCPQHGNRQDRAEKPGSQTAYTESRSGLAIDFPARPVRVPWLLRATG